MKVRSSRYQKLWNSASQFLRKNLSPYYNETRRGLKESYAAVSIILALLGYFLWNDPLPAWIFPLEGIVIVCIVCLRYREIHWLSWICLVLFSYIASNLCLDIDYSLNLQDIDTWSELVYLLIEVSFLPVLSSWYVFEPAMILIQDKFSDRIAYFADRYFYFLGYGAALTLIRICANDRLDLAILTALIMIGAAYRANTERKLPKNFEGVPYRRRAQTIDPMDLAGDNISFYLKNSK
jgi:hypothetical protein